MLIIIILAACLCDKNVLLVQDYLCSLLLFYVMLVWCVFYVYSTNSHNISSNNNNNNYNH